MLGERECIKAFLFLCLFLIQIYLEFKDLEKLNSVKLWKTQRYFQSLSVGILCIYILLSAFFEPEILYLG